MLVEGSLKLFYLYLKFSRTDQTTFKLKATQSESADKHKFDDSNFLYNVDDSSNISYFYKNYYKTEYSVYDHFASALIPIKSNSKFLDLSNLQLSKIPEQVCDLKELEELILDNNVKLLFELPKNLCSLKKLSLKNCNILKNDLIKISNEFPNLEQLDLSENQNIEIPQSFGADFPKLKTLSLSNCKLTFSDLKNLKCFNLKNLNFDQNDLSMMTSDYNFGNLNQKNNSGLKKLNVAACRMKYDGLLALTNTKISVLDASLNNFYKTEVEYSYSGIKSFFRPFLPENFSFSGIFNWGKIVRKNFRSALNHGILVYASYLKSNDWHLSWLKPSEIDTNFSMGKLRKSLKELSLNYCFLNKKQLNIIFKNMENVEILNIYGNTFGNVDENFDFGGLKDTLKEINLGFSDFPSSSLVCLTKLRKLKKLSLDSTPLQSIESFDWKTLQKTLKELDLSFTGISVKDIENLSYKLPNLTKLVVSNNKFNSNFQLSPEWKRNLRDLTLNGCIFSQEAFNRFMKCENLEFLSVERLDSVELLSKAPLTENFKKNLKILKIEGEDQKSEVPEILSEFYLKELHLKNINLSRKKDETKSFNSIQVLKLKNCKLDFDFFQDIGEIEELKSFNMDFVEITNFLGKKLKAKSFENLRIFRGLVNYLDVKNILEFINKDCRVQISQEDEQNF